MIQNQVSCLKCKTGYRINITGLIKTCGVETLPWWAWLLIALGIAIVLGAIIAVIATSGSKPQKN
jgi:hypothetical protein